jgi:hypothetical protein
MPPAAAIAGCVASRRVQFAAGQLELQFDRHDEEEDREQAVLDPVIDGQIDDTRMPRYTHRGVHRRGAAVFGDDEADEAATRRDGGKADRKDTAHRHCLSLLNRVGSNTPTSLRGTPSPIVTRDKPKQAGITVEECLNSPAPKPSTSSAATRPNRSCPSACAPTCGCSALCSDASCAKAAPRPLRGRRALRQATIAAYTDESAEAFERAARSPSPSRSQRADEVARPSRSTSTS